MAQLPSLLSNQSLEALAALARAAPCGCFVEVGVFQGGSAQKLYEIAEQQERRFYLYDTFAGIPFKGPEDSHDVGDFTFTDIEALQAAMPRAHITAGIFPASMVAMPPVAFAHIDCDQYESIAGCIRALVPQLVPGGVMLFDDYGALAGATQAVNELIGEDQLEHPEGRKVYYIKGVRDVS